MVRRISRVLALGLVVVGAAKADFSLCKFNFGVDLQQHSKKYCFGGAGTGYVGCSMDVTELQIPTTIDFLAMFVGYTDKGAGQIAPAPYSGREGAHLKICKNMSVTPVWYSYIIAEGAKQMLGVKDCNAGGGLCTKGAQYIRDNRATILAQYKAYATFAATNWGTTKPIIIALEPDYYQYTYSSQQNALSYQEANLLLIDIATAIKSVLPNAWLSMDISTWAGDSWWSQGIPYEQFKFMNTSGGVSSPDGTIKDALSWSKMYGISKKGMIGDDGYGTAGALTNPNPNWANASNLNSRITDGVIGVMEAVGDATWASKVEGIRASLNPLKTCVEGSQFALTLSAGTGGSIQASPAAATYDSNTTVQLTAVPQTGYRFVSWGGAASGTSTTTSVVMNQAKTVSATFAVKSTVKYTLTLTTPVNGTLSVDPAGTSFDSGSTVQVTAKPAVGYKFASWTGDATGASATASILMTGAKTVGATFVVDNTPVTLTVTGANGTVSLDPVQPTSGYARGTKVSLTPVPSVGYDFISWSGAASGTTKPLAVSMDSNMTISVIFRKQGEVSNLLKNGDGSSTTNWTSWSSASGTSFSVANDSKAPSNSVFSTKGNYGEAIADTAFMVTQTGFQLVAGTTYYITFRAMVSSPDGARSAHPLGVRVLAGTATAFKKSDSVIQDTSWHSYSYSFKATASGVGRFDFLLGNGGDRNWQGVLLDDVVLSDVPPVGVLHKTAVRPLGLRVQGTNLDLSLPATEGKLTVEVVSINGADRKVLLETNVSTGTYRASLSVDGLRPGIQLIRVRNGANVYGGNFTVVK